MIDVSVFRNFWDTTPASSTLEAMVEAVHSDQRTRELTEGYRQQKQEHLKNESMLFAVPCIFEGGKAQKHVVRLTGMAMVDMDHIANEELRIKKEELKADPHTLLCYTTISGKGLRVLYRYELDEGFELKQQILFYKKAFLVGNAYYERLIGVKADGQCKNVTRLSVVAHDAEVYYNPEAESFTKEWINREWEQTQQPMKEDRKRNRELARIRALFAKTIRPEVESEGAVYAPGSHNDYVMRVGYRLNQFGFTKEVAMEWAAEAFNDYDKAASVVESCYEKTEEHGTRGGRKYPHGRFTDSSGQATVEEIKAFLRGRILLRHNVITGRTEVKNEQMEVKNEQVEGKNEQGKGNSERGKDKNEDWQPITDRVVNSLWAELSKTKVVKAQDIYRVIESDFVPEFHPFKEYLQALPHTPPCEGGDPIRELADTVRVKGGEEEQRLFCEYLRKWLVGMVAGWVDDTVVNNVILVLIGEQGSYKTTWFNYLLPPELSKFFYTKTNANRMGRDDLLTLAQYGLVCCEELDTMSPKDLNQLKAAVTMPSIDERAAYAHFHEHRKHIASFCGTGNNVQFLSDPTGNRRWLPFEVEHIRSPRETPFNYEGIYRQAYTLYREGFQYWFSREEITRLSTHNRQFETPRLEHELVQTYFRKPGEREAGEFMSVALAMQIVGAGITQKLSTVSLGRAFVEQGYERRTYHNTRGYIVVLRTGEEMRMIRHLMAHDSTAETKNETDTHTDDTDVS